jgi:hypothetical protein
MIEKIQTDLNKNITYMLTNLSKPKSPYKEFNTKIMKIIKVLIAVLTDFTVINETEFDKYRKLLDKPDFKLSLEKNIKAHDISTIKPVINVGDGNLKNIIKIILTLEYYNEHFDKNIVTEDNQRKLEPILITIKTIGDKK